MSYVVNDRIGGKRIRLVYDANLISLPVGGSSRRLARSRQAGRHMRQHRARAALFLRVGHAEHWWAAGQSGTCIAAGIMRWLHGDVPGEEQPEDGAPLPADDARPADFAVLVPLDERVYVCTVSARMIEDERVLPADQALARVTGEDSVGLIVFAWQVGDRPAGTAGEVDAAVQIERAPFSLGDIRLETLPLAFARSGLFHVSHFVFAGLAAISVLSLLLLRPVMEIAGEIDMADDPVDSIVGSMLAFLGLADRPVVEVEVPEMREIVPEVPHGAADELVRLSAWLSRAEGLYGDGIARFGYAGGELHLEGRTPPRRYPSAAEALAAGSGGEFRIKPDGWTVSLPADMPAGAPRVPETDSVAVIRHMAELPHEVVFASGPTELPRRIDQEANTFTRELTRTGWRADLGDAAVGELSMLAEGVRGLPGTLVSADCALGEWRPQSCEIHLDILSF